MEIRQGKQLLLFLFSTVLVALIKARRGKRETKLQFTIKMCAKTMKQLTSKFSKFAEPKINLEHKSYFIKKYTSTELVVLFFNIWPILWVKIGLVLFIYIFIIVKVSLF